MWSYFACHRFFKHTKGEAAVCALIAGSPTIGFLGFAVLDPIFGNNTTTGLVVAIVAIVVNAVTIPIGLILLNPKEDTDTSNQAPKVDKNGKPVKVHKGSNNAFLNALKEPVVWVPILAVILVLVGIKFPPIFDPCFTLIAKANSGVAVFAAGLTLSSQPIEFDKEIIYNTFVKLILMPAALLVIGKLVGIEGEKLEMLVIAGALPPAFSGIIISSRFNVYVRTGTSSLAVSTILFMAAAPFWIWLSRWVATMHW